MSKITQSEMNIKMWEMAEELHEHNGLFVQDYFIEEWGVDRFAITFPDSFNEYMEQKVEIFEIEKPLAKFVNICHWWYARTTEKRMQKKWKIFLKLYEKTPYFNSLKENIDMLELNYNKFYTGAPVREVYGRIFAIAFAMQQRELQYQVKCPDCGIRLCIDTPIMCWNNGLDENHEDYDEETVCSECYWDNKWYETDGNEDNQEEIDERQGGLDFLGLN